MRTLILTYHRVYPGHHIDPETFEYQMRIIRERFQMLTLDEAVQFARGQLELKKDGAAITFDDGWADNFIYAYPILKKYGVPATIFTPTSFIGENQANREGWRAKNDGAAIEELAKSGASDQFLNWNEIKNMQPLVRVEAHGHTHAYQFSSPKVTGICGDKPTGRQPWVLLSGEKLNLGMNIYKSASSLSSLRYFPDNQSHPAETMDEYKNRVRVELSSCLRKIEENTGRKSKYLAWPFGEYNSASIKLAKEAGFEACLTTHQGSVRPGDVPYELNRFSPPRNRKIFLFALRGNIGMALYRCAVAAHSLLRKLSGS